MLKSHKKQALRHLANLNLPQLPAGILLGVLMFVLPTHAQSEVAPALEENPTEQPQAVPATEDVAEPPTVNPASDIPESDLDIEPPVLEDPVTDEIVMLQGMVLEMLHSKAAVIVTQDNLQVLLVSEEDLELTKDEIVEMAVTVSDSSLVEANEDYELGLDVPEELEANSIPVATAVLNSEAQMDDPLDSPTMAPGSEIEATPTSTDPIDGMEGYGEPSESPMMTPESGIEVEPEIDPEGPSSDSAVPQETMMVQGTVVGIVNPQAVLVDDAVNGKMLIISDHPMDLATNDPVEVMGVRSPFSISEAEEAYGLEFPMEMKADLEDATVLISLAYR